MVWECFQFGQVQKFVMRSTVYPLPDMPTLGFSNSAAKKGMMSKYGQMGIQLSD